MLYALLLLGLIPAVLLPDFLAEREDRLIWPAEPTDTSDAAVNLSGRCCPDDSPEDVLLPTSTMTLPGDPGEIEEGLAPLIEDDLPDAEVTVLYPVIEDDSHRTPPDDPDDSQAPVIEDDTVRVTPTPRPKRCWRQ